MFKWPCHFLLTPAPTRYPTFAQQATKEKKGGAEEVDTQTPAPGAVSFHKQSGEVLSRQKIMRWAREFDSESRTWIGQNIASVTEVALFFRLCVCVYPSAGNHQMCEELHKPVSDLPRETSDSARRRQDTQGHTGSGTHTGVGTVNIAVLFVGPTQVLANLTPLKKPIMGMCSLPELYYFVCLPAALKTLLFEQANTKDSAYTATTAHPQWQWVALSHALSAMLTQPGTVKTPQKVVYDKLRYVAFVLRAICHCAPQLQGDAAAVTGAEAKKQFILNTAMVQPRSNGLPDALLN